MTNNKNAITDPCECSTIPLTIEEVPIIKSRVIDSNFSAISGEFFAKNLFTIYNNESMKDLLSFSIFDFGTTYMTAHLNSVSKNRITTLKRRLLNGAEHYDSTKFYICQTKNKAVTGCLRFYRCTGKIKVNISYKGNHKTFTLFIVDTERDEDNKSLFDILVGQDIMQGLKIKI